MKTTEVLPIWARVALYVASIAAIVILVIAGALPAESLMLALPQIVALLNVGSNAPAGAGGKYTADELAELEAEPFEDSEDAQG